MSAVDLFQMFPSFEEFAPCLLALWITDLAEVVKFFKQKRLLPIIWTLAPIAEQSMLVDMLLHANGNWIIEKRKACQFHLQTSITFFEVQV